ncbi:MAG: DUF5667 domain-containing protein [Candidatus Paceibacterota bacterium]
MEHKNLNNGIKEIKKIMMTTDEKKQIFDRILNSNIPQQRVQSPWFGYSFMLKIHKSQLVYYVVVPLVIILTSSGVVLASEKSLPEDVLYPIKVSVVEPIRGAFTFSSKSKAKYQSNLATERLVEAEMLASSGKLDDSKEKKLNNLLEKHSISLNKELEKVTKENLSTEADEIAINFKAEMNAHARVLNIIMAEDNELDFDTIDNQISKTARSNADKVKISIKNEEEDDDEEDDISDKYNKKKDIVKAKINSKANKNTTTSISISEIEDINNDDVDQIFNEAKNFLDEAEKKELEGDSAGAYIELLNSESSMKEDDIFKEVKSRFEHEDEDD